MCRWRSGCKPDSAGPGPPCGTTSARSERSTTPPGDGRARAAARRDRRLARRLDDAIPVDAAPGSPRRTPSRRSRSAPATSPEQLVPVTPDGLRSLRQATFTRLGGEHSCCTGWSRACSPRPARVCFRVKVEGRENLPARGPVILASNHRSFLDSIFLPLVVRRRVTFVAKAEYFDDPKTAWFFRASGQIPIRREGGSASERALASATEVLRAGGVFGIYPEGTRTRDGFLHRGHTGVARLSLRTGAPIVPGRADRHRRGPAGRQADAAAVPARDDPLRRAARSRALRRPRARASGARASSPTR